MIINILKLIFSNLSIIKLFFKKRITFSSFLIAIVVFFGAKYLGFSDESTIKALNTFLGLDININIKVFLIVFLIVIFVVGCFFVYKYQNSKKIATLQKTLQEEKLETEILSQDLQQKEIKNKLGIK